MVNVLHLCNAALFFVMVSSFFQKGDTAPALEIEPEGACSPNGTFPVWMQGRMIANFSDGTFAYANFTSTEGTVLFEPGAIDAILTMSQPLLGPRPDGTFIWHECLLIHGQDPALRCSLIVPDHTGRGGYREYVHIDPKLVPICPTAINATGLTVELIHPIK
eukprot:m.62492 g.62492  ORF g.62492 m.62492 type:complete len:162 (+) comp23164_c0_seq1:204-689(+)